MGFLAPVTKSNEKTGASERVEKMFLPLTTFFVLPIFAFANAGFTITANALTTNQSVFWGIFLGLIIGKVIGITLASWLLVRLNVAQLPNDVAWKHIIGIGFIAGIGFTVSIFITELAFSGNQTYVSTAKMGIFIASATSALLGYILLRAHPSR
jgi:NhaA family Na+:H+ antiporter